MSMPVVSGDVSDDVDVTADPERPRADLLAELEGLRVENARLRDMLGLDGRAEGGNEMAWAAALLTEPDTVTAVDASSPPAVKIGLLWQLFGARADVYATRWESAPSGMSGRQPATKDRWSKGRPPLDFLPLTDEVFEARYGVGGAG